MCVYTHTHIHTLMYIQCAQAQKRVHYIHIERNGHGRLWWLIAAGCNTEVFHDRNHCFRPLRPRERRGYCLDFFAVIAMTAIRDEDPLDMVCDARRIKSVDPVIPLLSDEIKSLCVFSDGNYLSQTRFRISISSYYFKFFAYIIFIIFTHDFIK